MKNVVSIRNNELMDNLDFGTLSLKNNIKENILYDYANGIKFCNLKVFPSDFYWESGGLAKSWQDGDILNIGDVIRILNENNENILYYDSNKTKPYSFKVIDVTTIYDGQVLIELKLQECKPITIE